MSGTEKNARTMSWFLECIECESRCSTTHQLSACISACTCQHQGSEAHTANRLRMEKQMNTPPDLPFPPACNKH
eukprot:5854342-Pleurochrysis_carterae.AAC.1